MFTSFKVVAMDHKHVFQGSVWTVVGCLGLPPPLEKGISLTEGGGAVYRLGWSKPIQCDRVISLQYETHNLITVRVATVREKQKVFKVRENL